MHGNMNILAGFPVSNELGFVFYIFIIFIIILLELVKLGRSVNKHVIYY